MLFQSHLYMGNCKSLKDVVLLLPRTSHLLTTSHGPSFNLFNLLNLCPSEKAISGAAFMFRIDRPFSHPDKAGEA